MVFGKIGDDDVVFVLRWNVLCYLIGLIGVVDFVEFIWCCVDFDCVVIVDVIDFDFVNEDVGLVIDLFDVVVIFLWMNYVDDVLIVGGDCNCIWIIVVDVGDFVFFYLWVFVVEVGFLEDFGCFIGVLEFDYGFVVVEGENVFVFVCYGFMEDVVIGIFDDVRYLIVFFVFEN